MASYENLNEIVGRLKRASIDLWMKDEGYDVEGAEYTIASRGSDMNVTKPGADGEGGGDWHTSDFVQEWLIGGSKDDHFREGFAQIRANIDAIVEPWTDLPEVSGIAERVEECRQVARRLALSASSDSGGTSGGGQLGGTLGLIEQNLSAMSGLAIASFKDKFLSQLKVAVSGYHGVSVARGANVGALEGLFDSARVDVANLLDSAAGKIADAAQAGGGAAWTQPLTVAGWAAKGLGIFATGGAGLAVAGLGLGIEILNTANPTAAQATAEFSGYPDAMDKLVASLQELSDKIAAEEQAIEDNVTTNLERIRADKSSYDLTAPVVNGNSDVIALNPPLIDEITQVYMPSLKAELDAIASEVLSMTTSAAVRRSAGVGLGVYGPSYKIYDLTIMLYELIKNLSWDVDKGGQALHLALGDFTASEQERADALNALAEEVAAGNAYDPWD